MGLQAITIADGSFERAKLHDEFIRTMVFPGGCLPSVTAIGASVARTLGPAGRRPPKISVRDYAETLPTLAGQP